MTLLSAWNLFILYYIMALLNKSSVLPGFLWHCSSTGSVAVTLLLPCRHVCGLLVTVVWGTPAACLVFIDITVKVALLLLGNGESFDSLLGFLWFHPKGKGTFSSSCLSRVEVQAPHMFSTDTAHDVREQTGWLLLAVENKSLRSLPSIVWHFPRCGYWMPHYSHERVEASAPHLVFIWVG